MRYLQLFQITVEIFFAVYGGIGIRLAVNRANQALERIAAAAERRP